MKSIPPRRNPMQGKITPMAASNLYMIGSIAHPFTCSWFMIKITQFWCTSFSSLVNCRVTPLLFSQIKKAKPNSSQLCQSWEVFFSSAAFLYLVLASREKGLGPMLSAPFFSQAWNSARVFLSLYVGSDAISLWSWVIFLSFWGLSFII